MNIVPAHLSALPASDHLMMIEKHVQLVITPNQVLLPHVEAIDRMSITLTLLLVRA